jgi:O-antigen/teichoic acid export membrane protein
VQIILARSLPTASYGAFAIALAVLLVVVGAHSAVLAEPASVLGPAHHAGGLPEYLRRSFSIQNRIAVGAVAAAALAALTAGLADRLLGQAFWGLALAAPAVLWLSFLRRACYVLERSRTALLGSLVYAGLLAATVGTLAHLALLSPLTAGLALAAANGGGALVLLLVLRLPLRTPGEPIRALWLQNWRYGKWIFAANLAHWGGSGAYVFLVGTLVGLGPAGVFRAAQNLVSPVQQVLTALGMLYLPWLATERGRAGASRRWLTVWAAGTGLSICYAAITMFWGREILGLFYGHQQYSAAIELIPALAALVVFLGLAQGISLSLRAAEQPVAVFAAKISGAVFALSGGLALVARLGAPGAAWGLVLSATAECGVLAYFKLRTAHR